MATGVWWVKKALNRPDPHSRQRSRRPQSVTLTSTLFVSSSWGAIGSLVSRGRSVTDCMASMPFITRLNNYLLQLDPITKDHG